MLVTVKCKLLSIDRMHFPVPYEFQFIRKRLEWSKVFLLDDLKPVYAISTLGIEFRCSLKLSNKSLANTAKDLMHHEVEKMVGDLDYSLIRTPLTPLSEKEWKYCENTCYSK